MRSPLAALAVAMLLTGSPPSAAFAASSAGPRGTAPGAGARAKKPVRATHPDVGADPASDCASCHADATPEAYAAWRDSKHGLALVKCFVCHGSTGKDFTRRAAPDRCAGCHAEQVATLPAGGPMTKGKDCFSCHAAHALSPHAVKKEQTAAARVGADVELERERKAGPVNGPAAPPPAAPAPAATATATSTPTPASSPTGSSQPHPTTDKPQGSTP